MAIRQPSQYQIDKMEQGDIVFVSKPSAIYRLYRKFFLNKPKIRVRKFWSENCDEYNVYYQEDCTLLFYYETACVQTFKNEVPCLIGVEGGKSNLKQTILKSLQIGLYNVVLNFNSGVTLTIPVEYFDRGIENNKTKLKQIDDQRVIADLLKFQRFKGNYFKGVVEDNNIKEWTPAYCSVCGKPVIFHFEGDKVIIDNQCTCGELKLEKDEFTYDELSIWYYNQTNPTIKKLYEKFWFKRE